MIGEDAVNADEAFPHLGQKVTVAADDKKVFLAILSPPLDGLAYVVALDCAPVPQQSQVLFKLRLVDAAIGSS